MDFTNEINTLESEKLRFEKKEYAELAYQIWKNMKPDEHLMYTVRGVFRLLNIDSEWTK